MDTSGRAAGPKGCLGNGKWGVLESLPEGAVGGSLKLQDSGVRRPELREPSGTSGGYGCLRGTSLDLPQPPLKFPLPVPHSAPAGRTLPSAKPAASSQPLCLLSLLLSFPGSPATPLTPLGSPILTQVLPHVMKVSALREGAAMASPPPREMQEEPVSAGSEPGTHGCWAEEGGPEEGGGAAAEPLLCLGGGGGARVGGRLRLRRMSLRGRSLLSSPFRPGLRT